MKYFGTDGIRGIPNEKITTELAMKVGKALASLDCKQVVIATDTRLSKDMLLAAISSGILSCGMDVLYAGILPTPALIYYSFMHNIIGVMITASHNPYTDNGIKIVNRGLKLSKKEEIEIEELINHPLNKFYEIGTFKKINAKEEYINFIKSYVSKSKLKICIDCANGATYETAVDIFKDITEDLSVIGNDPDGYNINKNVGSTHLETLKEYVVNHKCDIGFAFDGDGDRVLCVDQYGNTIDGDKLIYLLAKNLRKKNQLKNNKIVLTIMSNLGITAKLKEDNIEPIEVNVGDKHVIEKIKSENLSLGGENSGHIILANIFHSGDGVLVASQIIKIIEEENKTISELLSSIPMYEDKMINIFVKDKLKIMNNKELFEMVENIKKEVNNDCKIIIRPSGTEEVIRVSVMAKDKGFVEKNIEFLSNYIKNI